MNNHSNTQEIHILDYLNVLVNARWIIARNFVVAALLSVVLTLVLPKQYVGETTLMPPPEAEKYGMGSILSEVTIPSLSMNFGQSSSSEILIEVLKSRSVKTRVLERKFKIKDKDLVLYEYLGYSSAQNALKKITKKSMFAVSKQGIITIAVKMNTAQLAADVANAFVQELDQVNQEKSVSRAKNSRIYIKSQLKETNEKLEQATRKLAEFQQENRAVSLQEQTHASIQQAGELKGRIIAKEVEIGVMLQTMKPENPLVTHAQKELEELNRRYHELQYGDTSVKTNESEFYVPFTDVPQVGLKLAELARDVKVQETVWQLLNQQYYQAKIEEARNTPTVQVLDVAVAPVKHFWPRKKTFLLVFGAASILFTILWVFIVHFYMILIQNPEKNERFMNIRAQLNSDWHLFKSRLTRKKF